MSLLRFEWARQDGGVNSDSQEDIELKEQKSGQELRESVEIRRKTN